MNADAIARMLPWVFQVEFDDPAKQGRSPLAALLGVMEEMHRPVESVIGSIDAPFAPYRAPDTFVAYLALWVDLAWLVTPSADGVRIPIPGGVGRLREVVAAASELSAQRGTATGLARFLEVATATQVVIENDPDHAFNVKVTVPAASRPYDALIRKIIDNQKPAHVSYDLVYAAAD